MPRTSWDLRLINFFSDGESNSNNGSKSSQILLLIAIFALFIAILATSIRMAWFIYRIIKHHGIVRELGIEGRERQRNLPPPPLSKSDMKKMPEPAPSPPERIVGEECAICLEKLKEGERCRDLAKCGHVFHVACIDRWLSQVACCPTCRLSPLPG